MTDPRWTTHISNSMLMAAAACFVSGAAVTVADVVARALFMRGVPAAIELTTFAIGLGALLSMPVNYVQRNHVAARLLSESMPNRFGKPLGRLGAISSVVFSGLLAWIVGQNAVGKWGSPETSRDLGLPMDVILTVVSIVLVLAFAASLIGLKHEWVKGWRGG